MRAKRASVNRLVRLESQRRTCEMVKHFVTMWICDDCPPGPQDGPTSRDEADRIIRLLDRRIEKLKPNAAGEVRRNAVTSTGLLGMDSGAE
jgi:hypothetical protein